MENEKKLCIDEFFDKIGEITYSATAPYRFAKHINYGNEKYKKGVVSSLTWVSNLSTYYLNQLKQLKKEFLEQIDKKEKELKTLKDGDFKKGVFDGFKMARDIIKDLD